MKKRSIVCAFWSTNKITPSVWKVTKEKSVYEAVKLASGGSLNWRSVMNLNKMYKRI